MTAVDYKKLFLPLNFLGHLPIKITTAVCTPRKEQQTKVDRLAKATVIGTLFQEIHHGLIH